MFRKEVAFLKGRILLIANQSNLKTYQKDLIDWKKPASKNT